MKPIIEIQGISKRFRITHAGVQYLSFRDRLAGIFTKREKVEDFWALKDVSFSVEAGEAIGIIGRNGAGKSTLLKVLSRITPPTKGRIVCRGRVASLLEVGTGFHLELTGRENIYMNGSILGLKKKEIDTRFDAIVDFAGTEKFLDTALKHYSSGMQLKLAFAVAAHLDPEVLIIDEVLAVGDAEFQRKCLSKMGDVVRTGRTLIFVSHNLEVVSRLCQRAVLLNKGEVLATGTSQEILSRYQQLVAASAALTLSERTDRTGNGTLRFTHIFLTDVEGRPIAKVFSGQTIHLNIKYNTNRKLRPDNFQVDIGVTSEREERLTWLSTSVASTHFGDQENYSSLQLKIVNLPFMPGRYSLTLFSKVDGEISDWIFNAFIFEVEAGDYYGSGRLNHPEWGHFLVSHQFTIL